MFTSLKQEECTINVGLLRKARLKGRFVWNFFILIAGFIDAKRGMVTIQNNRMKSPWLEKSQARYDEYSSDLYKIAGKITRNALVRREQVNDEIILLYKDLIRAKELIPAPDKRPETVEEKRMIAGAKREISRLENDIAIKVGELKKIKMALDEATHQMYQIMYSKNKIVERQILTYLRGAKQRAYGNDLLQENVESRELYEKLGEGFVYCIDVEQLLSDEAEKECDDYEYIQ